MGYADDYFFRKDMESAHNWLEEKSAGLEKKTLLMKIKTANTKLERYEKIAVKTGIKLQCARNEKEAAKYRHKLEHNRRLADECRRQVYEATQLLNTM